MILTKNAQIIYDYLGGGSRAVYCDNCRFESIDSVACEDCHRKMIGWEISEECAEKIALLIRKESGK